MLLSQIECLKKNYADYYKPPKDLRPSVRNESSDDVIRGIPHWRFMSAQQNPSGPANNAFGLQGEQFFIDCILKPEISRKLIEHIVDLTILSIDYLSKVDGWPLMDVFLGKCVMSMVSPKMYMDIFYEQDLRVMEYAKSKGARFMLHQDSDVTPHLENYAKFEYMHFLDVGQDTDFDKVAELFGNVDVGCILFPHWLQFHSNDEIREEFMRLMSYRKRFRSMLFTLWEIDSQLGNGKIFDIYQIFKECAQAGSKD